MHLMPTSNESTSFFENAYFLPPPTTRGFSMHNFHT